MNVLNVSPNPSSGTFRARWESRYSYKRVFVSDSHGRTYFDLDLNPNLKNVTLDLSKLPDGAYTMVFVNVFGHWITKKIMKAR